MRASSSLPSCAAAACASRNARGASGGSVSWSDLQVGLARLDQQTHLRLRARDVEQVGWRVYERLGTPEAIERLGVAALLEELDAPSLPRARRALLVVSWGGAAARAPAVCGGAAAPAWVTGRR